jgi:hypothetical protein
MVICYILSIVVGLAIALLILCIPKVRNLLYYLDIFSDKYTDPIDHDSHEGVKVVKETLYGGMLVIIASTFILGGIILLIYKYAVLNTLETQSILDSSMETAFSGTRLENKDIEINLTLWYYSGTCQAQSGMDEFPKASGCAKELGFGYSQYTETGNCSSFSCSCYSCRSHSFLALPLSFHSSISFVLLSLSTFSF